MCCELLYQFLFKLFAGEKPVFLIVAILAIPFFPDEVCRHDYLPFSD